MGLREASSDRLHASVRGTLPAVLTAAFVLLASAGLPTLLGWSLDGDTYIDGVIAMAAQWLIYIPAIAIGLWLAVQLDDGSLERYGLAIDRRWMINFLAGVGISAVVTVVYVGYGVNQGYFDLHPNRMAELGEIPLGFLLAFISAMLGFVFLGVVWEELVFRGVMLQNYAEGLQEGGMSPIGAVVAATLASLLFFGLYHLPWYGPFVWYTIGVGGIFVVAYLITGRLDLAIGVHFGRFTEELQGQQIAAIELPAILELGELSMGSGLELLAVEFAVSSLLILAWGYLINGSIRIDSRVYEPSAADV